MKKTKSLFTFLLTFACAIFLFMGIYCLTTGSVSALAYEYVTGGTAESVEGEVTLESFAMGTGASVKKTGEHKGMRFTTEISASDLAKLPKNAQFGTLIYPTHMLGGKKLTRNTAGVLDVKASVWKETSTEEVKFFTGVLVLEDDTFYQTEMSARAYVTYTDDEGKTYTVYAKNEQKRDYSWVVSAALKNGETGDHLTEVINHISSGIDFENKTISVKAGHYYYLNPKKGYGQNLDVEYSSSNEGVAIVDETGTLFAVSKGTANITATFNGETATLEVTVTEPGAETVIPVWNDLSSTEAIKTTLNRSTHTIPAIPTPSELSAIGAVSGASYLIVDGKEKQFGYAGYKILPSGEKSVYEPFASYNLVFDWYYDIPSNDSVRHNVIIYGDTVDDQYEQDVWHTVTIPMQSLLAEWDDLIDDSNPMSKGTPWLDFNWTSGSGDPAGVLYIGNIRIEEYEEVESAPIWSELGASATINVKNGWSITPTEEELTAIGAEKGAKYRGTKSNDNGNFCYSGFSLVPDNTDKEYWENYRDYDMTFDWYYDLTSTGSDGVSYGVSVFGGERILYAQSTWHTATIQIATLLDNWSKEITSEATKWIEFGWMNGVSDQYNGTLYFGNIRIEEHIPQLPVWSTLEKASHLTTTANPNVSSQTVRNGKVSDSKVAEIGGVAGKAYTSVTAYAGFFCYAGYQIVPTSEGSENKAKWEEYSEYDLVFDWYYDIIDDATNQYNFNVSVYGGEAESYAQDTWHTSSVPMASILADWSDVVAGSNNGGDNPPWTPWIRFKWTSSNHASQSGTVYIGNIRLGEKGETGAPDTDDPVTEVEKVEANVWTASGTEKFTQNDNYSSRYQNKTLTISSFQNESESGQIIITPSQEVNYYGIVFNSLTTVDGNILKANNFSAYHQLYVKIAELPSWTTDKEDPAKVGSYYPDALVPIATASRYGETTISSGKNQGVWITVEVSADQPAGVYCGEFYVYLNGYKITVPVEVTVYDFALEDEHKSQTRFGLGWDSVEYAEGLYGGSADIDVQRAYYEGMLDMGVSLSSLPGIDGDYYFDYNGTYDYTQDVFDSNFTFNYGGDGNGYYQNVTGKMQAYVEEVARYTEDDRVSFIPLALKRYEGVFYEKNSSTGEYDPVTKYTPTYKYKKETYNVQIIDLLQLRRTMEMLYEYSLQKNVNLFEKLGGFISWIDEFTNDLEKASAEYIFGTQLKGWFEKCKNYLANYKVENVKASESLKNEILNTVANIQVLATASETTENMSSATDYPFVFCPTIDKYVTKANDFKNWANTAYGEDAELWTYTCVYPSYPNPTYHLGDNLISSRLLSWIMAEYGITGNLYWAVMYVTDSSEKGSGASSSEKIDDVYAHPFRSGEVNGDGYLIYAGSKYGIKGFVGSIRLQSIKDGIEDYDLLYAYENYIKQRVALKGETYQDNLSSVMKLLTKTLYRTYEKNSWFNEDSGFEVFSDGNFNSVRDALASLLVLAKNGVVIENYNVNGDSVTVTVSAPEGVDVNFNGNVASQTANGIVTYTITLSSSSDGEFNISTGDSEEGELPEWSTLKNASHLTTTINPHTSSQAVRHGKVSDSNVAKIGGVAGKAYTSVTAYAEFFCYAGYQIVPTNEGSENKAKWEEYSEYDLVFDWYYDIIDDATNQYNFNVSVYGGEAESYAQDTWHTSSVPMASILADWSDVVAGSNNGGDNSPWMPWIKFKWTSNSHVSQAGTVYIGNIRLVKKQTSNIPSINVSLGI